MLKTMSDYKTPSSKRKTKKGRHKDKWNRNGKYTARGLRIKESNQSNKGSIPISQKNNN